MDQQVRLVQLAQPVQAERQDHRVKLALLGPLVLLVIPARWAQPVLWVQRALLARQD